MEQSLASWISLQLKHCSWGVDSCKLTYTVLWVLDLWRDNSLGEWDVKSISATGNVYSLESPYNANNYFSSALTILKVRTTDLGCFLITCQSTFFSLHNWEENKSILSLFLHWYGFRPQLCIRSLHHLYINAVWLSSPFCFQCIMAKLKWIALATFMSSAYIFSLMEGHKILYSGR